MKIVCPGGHWFTVPAEDVEDGPQPVEETVPADPREPVRWITSG